MTLSDVAPTPPPDRRLPLTMRQAQRLQGPLFSGAQLEVDMLENGALWKLAGGLCLGVLWRTKHQALREDDREHEWFLSVQEDDQ